MSARRLNVVVAGVLVIGLLSALFGAVAGADHAEAGVAVKQPPQPVSGPGGSNYTHHLRVHAGGSGNDAWYVFEPTKPRSKKAPVAVIMHGYGEYSGYSTMSALIRHTVRKGSIAIYPRWQTGIATPCPGPYLIQPCIDSAVNGIRGALQYLRARPNRRVQPMPGRASYFGFSFGGIITANLANRYKSLHLPKPRAIFLDDPHDGALTGFGEPALDDSLSGIPSTVKLECHSGTEGVFSEPSQGGWAGSCNAVFPMLGHIPNRNKDLVLTHTDDHGTQALAAIHGVCAAGSQLGPPNAYDWNFCWKVWDALRTCAYGGKNCRYALGNTRQHRSLGRWSDGTPVKPLKIQDAAPIVP
jgi:pimeloyl-ACP methyl ester carboxylesterase